MIDRGRLKQVKRGAYFVNLARGGVIQSLDVIDEALRDGRLAGAAIDVFDPSPPDTAHPLFANANCLTAPHAIATTQGAMTRIFKSMADDMAAILHGRKPQYVVNPEVLPK
jgi:phosphoglycerate dehydrogenase-like enzyme